MEMNNTDMEILYLVVPCYNEEEMLPISAPVMASKIQTLIDNGTVSPKSRILLVNDGSKDNTWGVISKLCEENELFGGVKLSRNRGHQNALLAGISEAVKHCDILISLDCDLQDDINAIDGFLDKRREGCDIVYGVRSSRKKDTFFKRFTAQTYYKILAKLGVEITYNHADYRLMSKRAAEGLLEFREVNLFLRGIVKMVGFKSDIVEYERNERQAGESKYPLKKMLAFAFEGITSLSIKPIRMITALGVFIFTVSILMLIYFLVLHFTGNTVAGWSTIVISIWGIGGLQLLAIGIIGEYIGKIYLETKQRPRFIIEDVILK